MTHKLDEKALEASATAIGYRLAALVSGNNQPDMSGDPRKRLGAHIRRRFDEACREAAEEAVSTYLAAEPSPAPVAVKALPWVETVQDMWWEADSYRIEADRSGGLFTLILAVPFTRMASVGRYTTLDRAKAAAQADYEARIRSALVDPVADEAGGQQRPAAEEKAERKMYCTDCECVVTLKPGSRCSCGSGRVIRYEDHREEKTP